MAGAGFAEAVAGRVPTRPARAFWCESSGEIFASTTAGDSTVLVIKIIGRAHHQSAAIGRCVSCEYCDPFLMIVVKRLSPSNQRGVEYRDPSLVLEELQRRGNVLRALGGECRFRDRQQFRQLLIKLWR